jgi:hypothetical protein
MCEEVPNNKVPAASPPGGMTGGRASRIPSGTYHWMLRVEGGEFGLRNGRRGSRIGIRVKLNSYAS